MSTTNDGVIWKLVVHRSDKRSTNELKSGLTYADAKLLKEDWEKVFNAECFFDPVPELKIKKQNDDEE